MMTDAPERIWIAPWREGDWSEGDWDDNEGKTLNDKPCIEYVRADRIEALTEQLAAARQDAKFAEDELEMQEQEACMMENDYIKLEKERDALEAKLAKAEAGLLAIAKRDEQMIWGEDYEVEEAFKDMRDIALATLAEIKKETPHDPTT
jgi:hypothetical protein